MTGSISIYEISNTYYFYLDFKLSEERLIENDSTQNDRHIDWNLRHGSNKDRPFIHYQDNICPESISNKVVAQN